MIYFASRLSKNISVREPEGYLICLNVPIARTGTQQYSSDECGMDSDEMVNVQREETEVFSNATMASFEGMPVTDDHPNNEVTADNAKYLTCGHAQNIRRGEDGEQDLLIADLIITDPELIRKIQSGKREVSCGYNFKLTYENDAYYQRDIRGNHIAIVGSGRAGSRVSIKDSAESARNERSNHMKPKKAVSPLARLIHAFARDEGTTPEELAEVLEGVMEQPEMSDDPDPENKPASDNDSGLAALAATVAALSNKVDELITKMDGLTSVEQQDEHPDDPKGDPESGQDPLEEIVEAIESLTEHEAGDEDESDPTEHLQNPQVISDDEAPEDEEKGIAKDALLGFLKAVKPVIATLPKDQRRKATDAALAEFKKASAKDGGKDGKKQENPYLALFKVKNAHATDSAVTKDPGKVGKDIMAKRNPHYAKK